MRNDPASMLRAKLSGILPLIKYPAAASRPAGKMKGGQK